jgi:hypothetical protein
MLQVEMFFFLEPGGPQTVLTVKGSNGIEDLAEPTFSTRPSQESASQGNLDRQGRAETLTDVTTEFQHCSSELRTCFLDFSSVTFF